MNETECQRIALSLTLHPNIVYNKGLQIAGKCNTLCVTNMEYFRSHFGTSPGVVSIIWQMISGMLPRSYNFIHVLWGLMFMKVYSTASVLSGKLGVDEGIYRNKCWTVVKAIASLKERVVSAFFCFYEKKNMLNLINKPLACFLTDQI